MSGEIDLVEYGTLLADVKHLRETVDTLEANVQAMRDLMEQGRGGWRVLVWAAGAVGAVGGGLGWALSHLKWG